MNCELSECSSLGADDVLLVPEVGVWDLVDRGSYFEFMPSSCRPLLDTPRHRIRRLLREWQVSVQMTKGSWNNTMPFSLSTSIMDWYHVSNYNPLAKQKSYIPSRHHIPATSDIQCSYRLLCPPPCWPFSADAPAYTFGQEKRRLSCAPYSVLFDTLCRNTV